MNEADALELIQVSFWTLLVASAPIIVAAMLVGTVIAFIQALTQIQEVTLTFIPKIVMVLIVSSIAAPFIGSQIATLATFSFARIATGY